MRRRTVDAACSHLFSPTVDDMLAAVMNEIAPLGKVFAKADKSLYLVGGIVRDLLLDAPLDSLDFDLTTNATPREIAALVAPLAEAVWTQGERFGTIGCQIDGRPYELSLIHI